MNVRPELRGTLPDLSGYDTIVLGYPCWWGTMPQAVFTFLERHQKTLSCGNGSAGSCNNRFFLRILGSGDKKMA